MKDILKALKGIYNDIRKRANAALQKLEPIDQIQAAQPVLGALREFEWSIERLADIGAQIEALPDALAKLKEDAVAAALTEKVEKGELRTKEDVEAAIAAAKQEVENTVKAKWQGKLADIEKLTERREEAVKKHGAVAANIGRDDLLADDYAERLEAFAERVTVLDEAGLTAEKAATFHAELTSLPLDEAGKESFDGRMAAIREIAGGAPDPAPTPEPKKPGSKAPVPIRAQSGGKVKKEDIVML